MKPFYAGKAARDNHCRATGHSQPTYECERCPSWFRSMDALDRHMNALNHFADVYETPYSSETWLFGEELVRDQPVQHHYCNECDRHFINANNLKMHMNSRTHKSGIACPFCKGTYATATGLTHHLERGSCPQARNLNRDTICSIVRSKDTNGVISKNLIGWSGSSVYTSSERAWNGHAYECYLCHRGFSSLHGLNQHLASPIHQQVLYHCHGRTCRQDFKTLGALCNHLESESCGAMRFDRVQSTMTQLVDPTRRLVF